MCARGSGGGVCDDRDVKRSRYLHDSLCDRQRDGNSPVSRRQQITFWATLIFHLIDGLVSRTYRRTDRQTDRPRYVARYVLMVCVCLSGCLLSKSKSSPYSTTERRVPELIPVLGSQPAGDMSHKPGGRLPLLSARPAVTLATLKRAATNLLLGEQRHDGCEQFA